MSNYWNEALDGIEQEISFGIYGQAIAQLGYYVYASGYTGSARYEKCWFPYVSGGQKEAFDKAKAFSQANAGARVQRCHALQLFRDACIRGNGTSVSEPSGESQGWQSDQFDPIPLWPAKRFPDQPSSAKARLETADRLNVPGNERFYGRFVRENDPYKESIDQRNEDGNFDRFYNVAEVYESESVMLAAAGLSGTSSGFTLSETAKAAGWTVEALQGQKDAALAALPAPNAPIYDEGVTKLAEEWQLDTSDIYGLLGVTPM